MSIAIGACLPSAQLSSAGFRKKLLELHDRVLWCPGCGLESSTCHARVLEGAVNYLKGVNDAEID